MGFLLDKCKLKKMDDEILSTCHPFTCGDEDLDDFFLHDAMRYKAELLGKTYCFVLDDDPKTIVCMFTLSNDSIRVDVIPNSRGRKLSHDIPREKRMRRYPAVLIGRLGISTKFQHLHIGTEVMDFIKSWFVESYNKTGCRYLVVDAYNEDVPVAFYKKNGFDFMFSTEEQEKSYRGIVSDKPLKTRLMYFDLILIK